MSNSTSAYIAALKRFWWLCVAGFFAALLAAFLLVYSISLKPLKLTHRAKATYTSSALLLVNSTANPYLRTGVTTPAPPQTSAVRQLTVTTTSTSGKGAPRTATPVTKAATVHAPDTHTLVQAANLFPMLIQSDQITRKREKMFGPLAGSVTAKAIYSFVTPSRFKQSSFPVIQVTASAAGPKAAKRLAQETTAAFTSWLVGSQRASHVPVSERILVQELQAPAHVSVSGKTKKSLPLAVFAVVLFAFLGLAILLDRMRPRVPASRSQSQLDSGEPAAA